MPNDPEPIALNPIRYEDTQFGFRYGAAEVIRMASCDKRHWVLLGITTPKCKIQIYVTKTGKLRVFNGADEDLSPIASNDTTPDTAVPDGLGPIREDELYPVRVLKQRLGWGQAAFRHARRKGLAVVRFGNTYSVHGRDVVAFLLNQPPKEKSGHANGRS